MKVFASVQTWVAVVAILAGSAVSIDAAQARSAICVKLERQLASAGSQGSSGGAKFSNAARAQAQQLQIARGQARRSGCAGSFFSDGNNSGTCTRLNSTIRRMESNLSKLQNRANSGGSPSISKARIRAALDANDCYGRPVEAVAKRRNLPAPTSDQKTGLLTMLFGGDQPRRLVRVPIERARRNGEREHASVETVNVRSVPRELASKEKKRTSIIVTEGNGSPSYSGPGGTFRTLCVRTCDGYYFPVSFSTTSSRFSVDEKACAAMCPGAETKLYYHSIPDQEPEEMIGLDRQPYMSLPTAFQYRVNGITATTGCSCTAASAAESEVPEGESAVSKKRQKWIPLPMAKPDLYEDSETAMNRIGNLGGATIFELIEAKSAAVGTTSGRKIRVVGPVYLPAQSAAEVEPIPGRVVVQ